MQSRIELVTGAEFRVPASPYAKRFIVDEATPSNGGTGYARGCLWLNATTAALYCNTGTESAATWTAVGGSASSSGD